MPSCQKHHLLSIILWLVIPSVVFVPEYYFFISAEVRGRTAATWWMPQVTIDLIGFVRSLWVNGSPDKINDLLRRMEEAKCSSRFWMLHHDKTGVALHSSLRSYIDWFSATITIGYHNPTMTLKTNLMDFLEEILTQTTMCLRQSVDGCSLRFECWHKLYIQKENADDVFHFFYHHYPKVEDRTARLQKEVIELKELAQYEELGEGMPEVY